MVVTKTKKAETHLHQCNLSASKEDDLPLSICNLQALEAKEKICTRMVEQLIGQEALQLTHNIGREAWPCGLYCVP
jgi:hypothetical protein